MQRYFTEQPVKKRMRITDATIVHHLFRVMRKRNGDSFVLCDSNRRCYEMRIASIAPDAIGAERLYAIRHERHPLRITLAQSLIRKEKFELVIQKASELGVTDLLPLSTERTVVKLTGENKAKKLSRFQKIAKEAAKQTRRDNVMDILAPSELSTLDTDAYDHVVVPYEEEKSDNTKSVMRTFESGDRVLVVLGPEGGFSEEEIRTLKAKGAKSVSLGPRILRSETAAFYVLSAISYETEMSE